LNIIFCLQIRQPYKKPKKQMEIKNITILGAGTMGHGIAQAALRAGYSVTLFDIETKFLEKGPAIIKA
jgi:3-hydroxybutyryl-CoA dehydrogenase